MSDSDENIPEENKKRLRSSSRRADEPIYGTVSKKRKNRTLNKEVDDDAIYKTKNSMSRSSSSSRTRTGRQTKSGPGNTDAHGGQHSRPTSARKRTTDKEMTTKFDSVRKKRTKKARSSFKESVTIVSSKKKG